LSNWAQSVAKSISLYFVYRLLCPLLDAEARRPSWRTCVQSDGNLCRCQTRRCEDKGNTPCLTDVEVRLENCTVDLSVGWVGERSWEILGVQHGNWSEWGNWSECSRETWAGLRNRSRTCTSRVPRRGGRTCVGDSIQYEPCSKEGVSGRPQGSYPSDCGCNGPIIGAVVAIFVFAVFCLAAIYYVHHRRTYQLPGDTFANHALL